MKKIFFMFIFFCLLQAKWQDYGFNYKYEVGIMTGGIKGTYIKFGNDIMTLMDKTNSKVLVRPIVSKGSQINLIALKESPGVDLAIVQADVMQAYKESGIISRILNEIRYITFLYNEEVHIITLKNAPYRFVTDLVGKNVCIGSKGSGTELTSNNIFTILDLNVNKLNCSTRDSFNKLLNHQVEAIILVGGKPLGSIIPYLDKIKFLSFKDNSIDILSSTYLPAKFTSNDYRGILDTKTIAVPSILVAYNWTYGPRYKSLKQFVSYFMNNLETLKEIGLQQNNKKWKQINFMKRVPGWKRHKSVREAWLEN